MSTAEKGGGGLFSGGYGILKKQLKRLWIKVGMEYKKFINSAAIIGKLDDH